MKQLTINPSNKPYYSEDFIKGFECGTQRQLEADLADRPVGEWIPMTVSSGRDSWKCSVCGRRARGKIKNLPYCHCGARMKGESNEY